METAAPGRKRRQRREWVLLAASVLILLAVVLPPLINLGRYQRRITEAMQQALGRPVRMRSVSLQLLPAPALVLADVEVEEDAGFGAEPALRAPSLVARLRLPSLWRGQLEVSEVDLADASINLIRNDGGHWNLGSLLLQAAHVSNAPTAQRTAGPSPRFPYVELTDARINVKRGAEKLPYTLENVDLSFWLDTPGQWRLRLEGQPVRTDLVLGLSDTGTLRLEGTLERASELGRMPVHLHLDWDHAPLGQGSLLLLARDAGWRGEAHLLADLSGDLDDLSLKTHLELQELHREDWAPEEPFAARATCTGHYSRAAGLLDRLHCQLPVANDGQLLLTGALAAGGAPADGAPLTLTAQHLPASFLLHSAQLVAHGAISHDLAVSGPVDGDLQLTPAPGSPSGSPSGSLWTLAGQLSAPRLELTVAREHPALPLQDVILQMDGSGTATLSAKPLALGGDRPLAVDAQLTRSGYTLHAAGGAALQRVAQLGLSLPPALPAVGRAELDLTQSGQWQAHAEAENGPESSAPAPEAPALTGSMRLRNARLTPAPLATPILIPMLETTWLPTGDVVWSAPNASIAGAQFAVTAQRSPSCDQPPCPVHFRASSSRVDVTALRGVFEPAASSSAMAALEDWLRQLSSRPELKRSWPPLMGDLHIRTLLVGEVVLHDFSADLGFAGDTLELKQGQAEALAGLLNGSGTITFSAAESPKGHLQATLSHASAEAAGAALGESWGPGTLDVSADLRFAGRDAATLQNSAAGTLSVEWLHGALGVGTPLARFARWSAAGAVAQGVWTLKESELTPTLAQPAVPVSGTIGVDRSLHLLVENQAVAGTLAHPEAAPTAAAESKAP